MHHARARRERAPRRAGRSQAIGRIGSRTLTVQLCTEPQEKTLGAIFGKAIAVALGLAVFCEV
jgi:hypothetical protein